MARTTKQVRQDDGIVISRAVAERIVNSLVAVGITARLGGQASTLQVPDEVRFEFDELVSTLQSRLRESAQDAMRRGGPAKLRARSGAPLRLVVAPSISSR